MSESVTLMRLIPAHAGNTRKPTPPTPCVPADPRSRGEHQGTVAQQAADAEATESYDVTQHIRAHSDR